ncbi:MAG TPA: hypothetical protein VMQ76_05920 [Terracidiphilus sp.]|jgi:hypothetical protein|nr:hypothetical protein [Terracidiphilus sp.]
MSVVKRDPKLDPTPKKAPTRQVAKRLENGGVPQQIAGSSIPPELPRTHPPVLAPVTIATLPVQAADLEAPKA